MSIPTMGFALDLEHRDAARMLSSARSARALKSREALNAVRLFKRLGRRYCVIAGALHRADRGVVAVGVLNAVDLPAAVIAANQRLAEMGAAQTAWVVLADDTTQAAVMEGLAEYSGWIGGVQ